jgi:DNA polymerase III subunit delta
MASDPLYGITAQFNTLIKEIKGGKFRPLYILCGEETYYTDEIISTLMLNVLKPEERDFNQTLVYASDPDINADTIVSMAKRYPMFAEHQLIIVKEAQELNQSKILDQYISSPLPQTVMVLAYSKSIDKRTGFYKNAKSSGALFESTQIKEWEVERWITSFLKEKGVRIEEEAAKLMSDYIGNNLKKILLEIDKIIKNLPEESKSITVKDVELNVGISREFSTFELCSAIGKRDAAKAFKIAHYMGENPKKYPIQMTLGALFYYFSRILRAHAYYKRDGGSITSAIENVTGYGKQKQEYSDVMKNYSLSKIMGIISKIREYDYKSKSNSGGTTSEGDLLIEFISKCLH